MSYDSEATKTRLLDAAFIEFTEHGLAGSRVDRIAATASVNKQSIYAYFGSKEALFEAVLTARLGIIADAVPFTPDNLSNYATGLFDYLLNHPEYMRLTMWKQLEHAHATPEEISIYQVKVDILATVYHLDSGDGSALDLLLFVIAAASAWATTIPDIRTLNSSDLAQRITHHRDALKISVAATVRALTHEHK